MADTTNSDHNTKTSTPFELDGVLSHFASLADSLGVSIPVTLVIGGALVSGRTIPSKMYHERVMKQIMIGLSSSGDDQQTNKIYPAADGWAPPTNPAFIHMENVTVFHGQSRFPSQAAGDEVWRFKLADIAGFTLGQLAMS